MKAPRLIRQSLLHYWRGHLGVLLGGALGTAVLVGALIVGDSVRGSLREQAYARLARITHAVIGNDRFVREDLARLTAAKAGVPVEPAILLPGVAARADGTARANRIQVLGVRPAFFSLSPDGKATGPELDDEVWLNQPLATQLNTKQGDTVVLRLAKPSLLSRDAPLSPTDDTAVALRLKVSRILDDGSFGRFSFQASQVAPLNAFVKLALLQNGAGVTNQANVLVAMADGRGTNLAEALRAEFRPADAGLRLLTTVTHETELRSSRVFIDPPIAELVNKSGLSARPILTYFANGLTVGTNTTPYSMATALDTAPIPLGLKDDEILLNQWTADDLQAKVGDPVSMTYYVVGPMRQLVEAKSAFRVRSILPMSGPGADRDLMPDFPGMSGAENCRDWDTGFPIKTDAIRDKDEAYWKQYRGTPKAFVNLATGQRMWGNRFGNLTAFRFDAPLAEVEQKLSSQLNPALLGLAFVDVQAQATAASTQGLDFGQYFIGFSFFLIGSALLLMGLLLRFGLEQRRTEIGVLLALGWTPKSVRNLLLREGTILGIIGAIVGALSGWLYAKAMLLGLSTVWSEAVAAQTISLHVEPTSIMAGAISGVVLSFLVTFWSVRKAAARPARELLQEGGESDLPAKQSKRRWLLPAWVCLTGLGALAQGLGGFMGGKGADPETFFGAGGSLLLFGIAAIAWLLRSSSVTAHSTTPTLWSLSWRGIARRRGRSQAVVALIACGVFLIASLGVFRLDAARDADLRSSGTGGFQLVGESALAVIQDLNSAAGREAFNLNARTLTNVSILHLRLHEGDDASCLNLNRAQRPRLLGVNPAELARRGAFSFAETLSKTTNSPWGLLDQSISDGEIPVIGDANSIQYALGSSVGGAIPYTDERGQTVQLRIVGSVANSILQGGLIMSEKNFNRMFPSESGYRFFLIDLGGTATDRSRLHDVSAHLGKGLQDLGLELIPAVSRLNAFNAVQNTYLGTFQLLGGLGLILGTFGLGVVVLRHVLERRGELGVLQAIGFEKRSLRRLVLGEHALLLFMGLVVGIASAGLAVLPVVLAPGGKPPGLSLWLTLLAVAAFGIGSAWLATRYALRGSVVDALREE